MLTAAVIGLGVGEQHARYFNSNRHYTLKGVCDLDKDKASACAKEYGAKPMSWVEILADPEIDVVSIASFDHHHAKQVCEVLRAGKHVFVEKPLCRTLKELKTIKKIWEGSNKVLLSNLPLRKAAVFKWLKEQISKDELGEIYAIDAEYLYGRVKKITEGWRNDIDEYSVIEGGGIHMLDVMIMVTGQYPHAVSTNGNQIATRGSSFKYSDYTASTFQFRSGMIGRLTANFGCVHPHQYVLKVFGTKGTFILDDMGPRYQTAYDPLNSNKYNSTIKNVTQKPSAKALDLAIKPESKAMLLDDLRLAIERLGEYKKVMTHEFRLINACLAAEESLQTGKTKQINQE